MPSTEPPPAAAADQDGQHPLHAELLHFMQQMYRHLKRDKIDPWIFVGINDVRITDAYGKEIRPGALVFSGSIRDRFWHGFIEPFLEDMVIRLVKHAINLCDERGFDRRDVLETARRLSRSLVIWAYHAMDQVEISHLRRAHQTNLSRPHRPVQRMDSQPKAARMHSFVDKVVAGWPETAPAVAQAAPVAPTRPEAAAAPAEMRDAEGFVIKPLDPHAFLPASKILAQHPAVAKSMKVLHSILERNQDIRRYRPRPQRLSVHAGDFQRYVDREATRDRDPDNPAEIEARKRAVRAASKPRPNARVRKGSNLPVTLRTEEDSSEKTED